MKRWMIWFGVFIALYVSGNWIDPRGPAVFLWVFAMAGMGVISFVAVPIGFIYWLVKGKAKPANLPPAPSAAGAGRPGRILG